MENTFNLFAPAYLKKGGEKEKTYKIVGVISTDKKDIDGEILLTEGLDLSYLEGGWGKIKYEHDNEISKEPDNVIGFPTKVIKKPKSIDIEAELIEFDENIPESELTPQQRNAKSVVGLLKAVEEYNKKHPDKPQKVGFSVEGDYVAREKTKEGRLVKKARVVNVVLTLKPKNTTTIAKLAKSLQLGYGMTPETQTGLGAIRKESLEGHNKQQFSKGENNMNFKSFDEAKAYFLSQGLTEEEAEKKAKEVMNKEAKPQTKEDENVEKSIAANLQKSINLARSVTEVRLNIDEDLSVKLEKSVKTMGEGEEADITPYFLAKQETDLALLETMKQLATKYDLLAKSVGAMSEGLLGMFNNNLALKKSIEFVKEGQKLSAQALGKVLAMRGGETFAPSDLLKLEVADYNQENVKLSKSIVLDALEELVKENQIPSVVLSGYEGTGYLDDKYLPMVKSKVLKMKKA